MENFFNWMTKPIPKEEIIIWFNVHNMIYEKIELLGDFFKSLNNLIVETYMGNDDKETKIILSSEDIESHFDWCWNKTIDNFQKENIIINKEGEHKNYYKEFFITSFYKPNESDLKEAIPHFLETVFNVHGKLTKSDLDILTELYKLLDKNLN